MDNLSNEARQVNTGAGSTNSVVSSQWWNRPADQRFLSLNALRDSVKAVFDASRSQVYDVKDLELLAPEITDLESTKALSVYTPDMGDIVPTHYSFGQMASLIGAPASYLRTLPSQLVADNMNWSLRKHRAETVKLYHRIDGTGELRAVNSEAYGRIPDYEVVEAVMRFAGNGDGSGGYPWKVPGVMRDGRTYDPLSPITHETTTLFASDRDSFIFLCDDRNPISVGKLANGDDDLMFRGFYVSNSEVGGKSLRIATMYLRAVCCNRILWGVEGFSELTMRHTSGAPERFVSEAMPALEAYSKGSARRIEDGVKAAQALTVAKDEEEGLAFLKGRQLSRARSMAVLKAVETEEGHPARTVWDMAQGITAVAREIQHQDDRLDLERTAKGLLDKVTA